MLGSRTRCLDRELDGNTISKKAHGHNAQCAISPYADHRGKNCKTHYGNACKSECGSELFGSPGIEATAHTKRKTFSLSSIKNRDFFGFFQYFARKPRVSGLNIDAALIWLAPGDQSQPNPESGSTTKTGRRILDI